MLRAVLVLSVGVVLSGPANAQQMTAQETRPGCEGLLAEVKEDPRSMMAVKSGYCAGVTEALISMGKWNSLVPICQPTGSNVGQAIRVVLKFMDDEPGSTQKTFVLIAGLALAKAWPCPKQ